MDATMTLRTTADAACEAAARGLRPLVRIMDATGTQVLAQAIVTGRHGDRVRCTVRDTFAGTTITPGTVLAIPAHRLGGTWTTV